MMFAYRQILSWIASLVAISAAIPLWHHYEGEQSEGHDVYHHAHPKYHYDYAVHDLHTGDVKNKWETRDGDVVKGYYSLNEPDGTIRKVEYTADKHNGFNAVVKRLGKSYHPEPVKHQLNYGGHNSFAEGNLGGYASTGVETFGSGGNYEASSYSNANLHSFGLHGGYH